MKRQRIPWENYGMRKYGLSIKKEIFAAHVPYLRVTQAKRLAEKAALLAMETDTIQ